MLRTDAAGASDCANHFAAVKYGDATARSDDTGKRNQAVLPGLDAGFKSLGLAAESHRGLGLGLGLVCSAIAIEAICAPSMRLNDTILPPESYTAQISFQSRFFDSATAAARTASARSSDMGAP